MSNLNVRETKLGWRKVLNVKDLVLFENPLKPSPFYYTNEGQIHFIHDYKFFYDRIEINIPSVDCDNLEIVATFISWPGWRAKLDDKPVEILKKEYQFIRVNCTNGEKLTLDFSPYSDWYIVISVMMSFVFLIVCCFFGSMKNKLSIKFST